MSEWLTDIRIEPRKAAGLETYARRKTGSGFSNIDTSRQLPSQRLFELSGTWVASNGLPYRMPAVSKERQRRLEQMRQDNDALLSTFLKHSETNNPNLQIKPDKPRPNRPTTPETTKQNAPT